MSPFSPWVHHVQYFQERQKLRLSSLKCWTRQQCTCTSSIIKVQILSCSYTYRLDKSYPYPIHDPDHLVRARTLRLNRCKCCYSHSHLLYYSSITKTNSSIGSQSEAICSNTIWTNWCQYMFLVFPCSIANQQLSNTTTTLRHCNLEHIALLVTLHIDICFLPSPGAAEQCLDDPLLMLPGVHCHTGHLAH
jgi:hypothetical protein